MVVLLDLPAELLSLRILWFLDLKAIIACQLAHRSLYAIIKDSVQLKYFRALKSAGMKDNPNFTTLSIYKRLHMLNLLEDAWKKPLIDFSQTIPVAVPADTLFPLVRPEGFNGGMCFFGEIASLHYFSLPSKPSEDVHWTHIHAHGKVKAIGYAVYEHDLIAMVVKFQNIGDDFPVYFILLFEASTGKPHPLAQCPKIFTLRPPETDIKIMGDYLAFVATGSLGALDRYEYIEIYEWKTGNHKMTIMGPQNGYGDILFLSPSILLSTNIKKNILEFWTIPQAESSEKVLKTRPAGVLKLPPLKDGYSIYSIECKSAPFFRLSQSSSVPFYASAEDSIAVFYVRVSVPDDEFVRFSLSVHVRSLLDACRKSNRLYLKNPSGDYAIPWDKWGPAVTRLHSVDSMQEGIRSTDSSDRCVFSTRNGKTVILDFNPARIHSRVNATTPEHEDISGLSVITSEGILDWACFEKPVASRLPYMQQLFPNTGAFRGVFVDGERLVGYRYDKSSNEIKELKVWHIGQGMAES